MMLKDYVMIVTMAYNRVNSFTQNEEPRLNRHGQFLGEKAHLPFYTYI